MMLAKLLICSSLIFLTRGTFTTLQKCTTRTQCTDNGKAPNTTQQTISLERSTLIPGKAGPRGLKGEQGERGEQGVRGKTGKRGKDCNKAKITTKITQIESIVKYEIESFKIVMVKNEAELHDQIEDLKTQLNETQINLDQSNERIRTLNDDLNETKNELSSANDEIEIFKTLMVKNEAELHDQVEDLKTQLIETQINLNQSNEQLQTLRDDLNETKNELSSANDKITRLEVKMQMLISATTTPEPTTPEPTTTEPTTPEPTTPEPTTPEPTTTETILSVEDRARTCGLISNIPDCSITVSTIWKNHRCCGPQHSRLFSTSGDGAWFPHAWQGYWIQVDLGAVKQVRGVATQSAYKIVGMTRTYSISFKREPSSNLQNVVNQSGAKKIFQGNTDMNTVVINDVDITARYIRITGQSYIGSPRLRFDILTC